jgi:hypothetical protein
MLPWAEVTAAVETHLNDGFDSLQIAWPNTDVDPLTFGAIDEPSGLFVPDDGWIRASIQPVNDAVIALVGRADTTGIERSGLLFLQVFWGIGKGLGGAWAIVDELAALFNRTTLSPAGGGRIWFEVPQAVNVGADDRWAQINLSILFRC